MNRSFLDLIDYLENGQDEPSKTQEKLLVLLKQLDEQIKSISVFLSDEMMIQKFGHGWLSYLLEMNIYNTAIGKELFYKQLDRIIAHNNWEYLPYYLIALRKNILPAYDYEHLLPVYQPEVVLLNNYHPLSPRSDFPLLIGILCCGLFLLLYILLIEHILLQYIMAPLVKVTGELNVVL